jgi:hypothetical protein
MTVGSWRRHAAAAVAAALVLGGCAGFLGSPRPDEPEQQAQTAMQRAERALERGNRAEAIAELLLVAGRCPSTPVERRALLTAAAVALDPANEARQLDLGASLAARYLATSPPESSDRPLAQSFYLLAIELGAEPAPPTGCGSTSVSDSAALAALPRVEAPSVRDRIRLLERELSRLRDELVRIRKTLEP